MKSINALIMTLFVGLFASVATARINGDGNTTYATRGIQTQGVYYRDATFDQPLIGVKMEVVGEHIFRKVTFELSEGTDPSILSNFKLYKTSVNYFAPARATQLTSGSLSVNGRTVSFDVWSNVPQDQQVVVKNGDYLWLTARVAYDAPAKAEIDAKITSAVINGIACIVENEDPIGAGMTYEFRRHVVPYYRMGLVGGWNDTYYDLVSEVIFFHMCVAGNGNLVPGWEAGIEYKEELFRESLERLRDGRGDRPVRIMLGIAHCASGLSAATQNDEARAKLVDQIIHYVELFGFDGVDIDWEYPESNADWEGFEKLVAELKPRLFALGGGKMVSTAMSNYKLWNNTASLVGLHQQLDMFNTMTYDQGPVDGQDPRLGHSPWWLHNESKYLATSVLGLPPIKANIGVPFYTNSHRESSGHITWEQMGYDWVYSTYPQYVDAVDVFYGSDRHVTDYGEDAEGNPISWKTPGYYSYNSIKTIREKGLDLRNGGYGVMIWAFECDIPYNNPKSLARALASTIRPTDDVFVDFSEVATAKAWGDMTGNKEYTLTTDLILTANDYRPVSFTGTVDAQGYTITLKGGAAILGATFEGKLKNATIVVEGDLNANGVVADTLQGNGLVENVTVVIKEGITVSGGNSAGAIVGDIWAPAKTSLASVKNCTAEVHGTITSSVHGRVGGIVGNMNIGYTLEDGESEPVRIQGCRAELYSTARLYAPEGTTHWGVGGLFGNGNTARECATDNSVVIYKGASLEAESRVALVTPGNIWGSTMTNLSNNWAMVEEGVEYSSSYADRILDFTIGEPDRKTKTAMVEYRDRETGVSFRIRREVIFSASGFSFRLR